MREDFRTIRRYRYALPEVVEPAENVCIQVRVPNDIAYLAAFWGQMFALTRWYAWLGDDDHTGKLAAEKWREVYEAARESECQNVLVRTSPVNDCLLQVSYDGGELWETVYNAYGCALTAAQDIFGTGSDQPAGHSQPGEQPGGANPAPAQCFDLDLTVPGNSMVLIPIAVASGWTLKLTNVKGAWWDGDLAKYWQCPDGHQFALGTCTANQWPGEVTDPIPTSNHMRLILRLADGTYDALPIDGTDYTVPAGQPAGNYFLMCNDSSLADNQGSVGLHLLACNAGWCYRFDFAASDQSFAAFDCQGDCGNVSNVGLAGVYSGGRWNQKTYSPSNERALYIYRDIGATENISRVRVKGNSSVDIPYVYTGFALEARLYNGGTLVALQGVGVTAGDIDHTFNFANVACTRIWITLSAYQFGGAQYITDVFAYGTDATNPFGDSNC